MCVFVFGVCVCVCVCVQVRIGKTPSTCIATYLNKVLYLYEMGYVMMDMEVQRAVLVA